jgi:hypothetical protein
MEKVKVSIIHYREVISGKEVIVVADDFHAIEVWV